jgi:hypothetical protein
MLKLAGVIQLGNDAAKCLQVQLVRRSDNSSESVRQPK